MIEIDWEKALENEFRKHGILPEDPRRVAATQRMESLVKNSTINGFFNPIAENVVDRVIQRTPNPTDKTENPADQT